MLSQCEKVLEKCIFEALTSYNSPLVNAVKESLASSSPKIKEMADSAVSELVNSDEFAVTMKVELKRKLARVLISQYGGEIEKSANKLKSDPASRAKMIVAIDSVMEEITGKKNDQ